MLPKRVFSASKIGSRLEHSCKLLAMVNENATAFVNMSSNLSASVGRNNHRCRQIKEKIGWNPVYASDGSGRPTS